MRRQEPASVRRVARSHVFGRSSGDDLPTGVSTLQPEVDDVVGSLDDVEVMLDQAPHTTSTSGMK